MTATRRTYVKKEEHHKPERHYRVTLTQDGKPVEGIDPDRITDVEETVMEWKGASHIHAWFLKNVQKDEDDGKRHIVSWDKLRDLLVVCDRVMNASHLVPAQPYKPPKWEWNYASIRDIRDEPCVIKNIAVAHKLLPRKDGRYGTEGDYDAEYLKAVSDTRSWIIRMFKDRDHHPDKATIYYSATRW